MKNNILTVLIAVLAVGLTACSTTVTSVYLLRHAERPAGYDPELTPEGHERAQELARILKNVPLAVVYSTDFNRTRQTVQPLSLDHNLEMQTYNDDSVASVILSSHEGKTSVIVGHSDTVPGLIAAFGGIPPFTILPIDEYDNLFLLIVEREKGPGSSTKTHTKVFHMKYGAESTN